MWCMGHAAVLPIYSTSLGPTIVESDEVPNVSRFRVVSFSDNRQVTSSRAACKEKISIADDNRKADKVPTVNSCLSASIGRY